MTMIAGCTSRPLPRRRRQRNDRRGSILPLTLALMLTAPAAATPAQDFQAENARAMDRMMAGMAVAPTGDVDVDFVNMMEPHHAAAVAMAVAMLRYGKNEQLRRIAQEIIVEQRQEIDAMRLAIGRPPLPAGPVPTQPPPAAARRQIGGRP